MKGNLGSKPSGQTSTVIGKPTKKDGDCPDFGKLSGGARRPGSSK